MQGKSIVSTRYAQSLLHLAEEKQKADVVFADMQQVSQSVSESADFRAFLKSPVIPAKTKEAALNAIFEGKVDPLTLLFLKKITDAGREPLIGEIARAFVALYKQKKGVITVEVKTVAPLSEELRKKVISMVKKSPQYASSEIEIEEKTDPSLIGGIVVTVDDKQVDASFARQIREFKMAFDDNYYEVNY